MKFAHAFAYYGHTMVQCMTCMESYYIPCMVSYDLHVPKNFYALSMTLMFS